MKNKKIVFEDIDDQHARMLIRLRYDKITQGAFFRGLVELYVNNDIDMAKVICKIKNLKSTMGKRKISRSYNNILKGEEMGKKFNFSGDEKTAIYDLIEGDFEEQND